MLCAPIAMACRSELQKRFTVTPAVCFGSPARGATMRPMFMPVLPPGGGGALIKSLVLSGGRPARCAAPGAARAEEGTMGVVEGGGVGLADGRACGGNDDGIDAHAAPCPDCRIAPLDSSASMSASGTPDALSTCTVDWPICCGAER